MTRLSRYSVEGAAILFKGGGEECKGKGTHIQQGHNGASKGGSEGGQTYTFPMAKNLRYVGEGVAIPAAKG